jgi:hypothetical protein
VSSFSLHRLRERDFGEAEGMTWTELKNLARSRNVKFSEYDPLNGENLACFRSRVTCFFNSLCRTMLAAPGPCPTLYVSGAEPVNRLFCGELDLDFGAGGTDEKNSTNDGELLESFTWIRRFELFETSSFRFFFNLVEKNRKAWYIMLIKKLSLYLSWRTE